MAKCAECGYLTITTNDGRYHRADVGFRNKGVSQEGGAQPLCFMKQYALEDEWNAASKGRNEPGKSASSVLADLLNSERECTEEVEWVYDYSAKEHYEMRLLEEQRERVRKSEEAQRAWELERLELERKWRDNQAAQERQWRKEDRRSLMIGLIATTGLAAVSAITALVAAGKLPWFSW